jgi:hypothetical protein
VPVKFVINISFQYVCFSTFTSLTFDARFMETVIYVRIHMNGEGKQRGKDTVI